MATVYIEDMPNRPDRPMGWGYRAEDVAWFFRMLVIERAKARAAKEPMVGFALGAWLVRGAPIGARLKREG